MPGVMLLATDDGGSHRFPALSEYIWRFDRPEDLSFALVRLTRCHPHNFGVQMDHHLPAIWGSEMAMECIEDDQLQRDRLRDDDPYEVAEQFFFEVLRRWFDEHTQTRRREMPKNIALDLRRALQRSSLRLARAVAPGFDD